MLRLKARLRRARIKWAQFKCPHINLHRRTWLINERSYSCVRVRVHCAVCGKSDVWGKSDYGQHWPQTELGQQMIASELLKHAHELPYGSRIEVNPN